MHHQARTIAIRLARALLRPAFTAKSLKCFTSCDLQLLCSLQDHLLHDLPCRLHILAGEIIIRILGVWSGVLELKVAA